MLVDGLKPGTDYHFICYGKAPTGVEGKTADATFRTKPVVAITGVTVSAVGAETAKINWQTDRDAKSYVKYDKGSFFSRKTVVSAGTVNHELVLTGLKPETQYSYIIYAEAVDTTENKTAEANFTTLKK